MQRRELLRALCAASVTAVAGCGRNEEGWEQRQGPPEPGDYPTSTETDLDLDDIDVVTTSGPGDPFTFVATEYGETDDGYLSVTATIENETERSQAAVLVFEVTVDDATYAERHTVRLDAGGRGTYRFVFDIERSEYRNADSKRIVPRWETVDEE